MKILHYFPGIERAGGLNRYAGDLAIEQGRAGHTVHILYPVYGVAERKKISVGRSRKRHGVFFNRLYGAFPLPLLEGVSDPQGLMQCKEIDKKSQKFIAEEKFDIIHIHTFMGLSCELVELFKKSGCKIVFTTHDYYPFCPQVNLIDSSGRVCNDCSDLSCSRCNASAPGMRYLVLRNSWLIKFKKILAPLAALKKRKNANSVSSEKFELRNYSQLREYYILMLKKCDVIHFNSGVSESVYRRYLPELSGKVIPITHSGIIDQRSQVKADHQKVRIGFVGSSAPYKGLPELLKAADELYLSGVRNFSVEVFGCSSCGKHLCDVNYHGVFAPSDAKKVYRSMDLLVVPSVWYETFGFIVAEALSYGVGVVVSDMVGAKMLLDEKLVYHTREELGDILKKLLASPAAIEELSRKICEKLSLESVTEHSRKIVELYTEI